jgi:hypothetical protein
MPETADRYASPDGLQGSEGAFSLCTFGYVDALAGVGRRQGPNRRWADGRATDHSSWHRRAQSQG